MVARAPTFMCWLRLGSERDVIELTQTQPLAVHRHAEVAQVDGLACSLRDLVCGGGGRLALRRQIRHRDSAVRPSDYDNNNNDGLPRPRTQIHSRIQIKQELKQPPTNSP